MRRYTGLSCLLALGLLGSILACAEPPAQDPGDLTQFPAASSVPPVHVPPASSASDALWPDAAIKSSK